MNDIFDQRKFWYQVHLENDEREYEKEIDEKIISSSRVLLKETIEKNSLNGLKNYPSTVNGVCELYYFTSGKYRILLLGEVHKKFDAPNLYQLVNWYVDSSPFFLDIFMESEHGDLFSESSSEALNFDMKFYFRGNQKVIPFRYHRFDLRGSEPGKYNVGKVRGGTDEEIRNLFQKLGHLPETNGEIKKWLENEFDNNVMIQKQVKKNKNADIIKNYIINLKIKYPDSMKLINNRNQDKRTLIRNRVNIAELYGFLSDAYLLLRLFKKFDSKIQPTRAYNSIVISGSNHTKIYADFLESHDFELEDHISSVNCQEMILPNIPFLF